MQDDISSSVRASAPDHRPAPSIDPLQDSSCRFSLSMCSEASFIVDLQNSLLGIADHDVQALTPIEIAIVPREAILQAMHDRPAVAEALWHDTLVDGSIHREWTANVGRRDSSTRMAHLLCEFALRLETAGLGDHSNYELPMTQEHLADCLGLTPVPVKPHPQGARIRRTDYANRAGRTGAGLAEARRGRDFNTAYLHSDVDGRSIDR